MYFDSINGSDGNDGLTLASAKQSLNAAAVVDGAVIYLTRGSYWRGSLGVLGRVDNLTIAAAGDAALPRAIIDGADLVEGWASDGAGAYSASVAFEVGSVGRIHAYEDAELLIRADSLAQCQGVAGTFYIDNFGDTDQVSPVTVYIHPTDGADPAVSGKKIEVVTRYKGIYLRADSVGCDISGVHLRRFSHNNGGLSVAKGAILNDVRSDFGGKHNAYLVDATIDGLELIDADAPTGDTGSGQNAMFVPFATTHSTARKTTARDLKAWYRKHQIENIAPNNMYGVISHTTNTDWVYGDLEFNGGVFQWQEYAFTGYIDELIVNDGTAFIDVAGLFSFVSCRRAALEGFQWRVLDAAQFGLDPAEFSGSMVSLPNDLTLRDGGIYAYSAANMATLFRVKGQDVALERMAFVSAGPASADGRRFFQDTGADGFGSFSANHNIFYGRQSSAYHLELHSGQSLSVDFNIYFTGISSQQVRLKYDGAAHATLSAWQSASGQDSNSVYVSWADRDTFWLGDPALGDFRINPSAVVYGADGAAYTGTFADGVTPLTDAEPQIGLTAWNELQAVDYAPEYLIEGEDNTGSGTGLDIKTTIDFSGFTDGVTPALTDENLLSYFSVANGSNAAPTVVSGELYWGDGSSDALMTYEAGEPSYNHVAQIVAGAGGAADVNRLKLAVCVPSGSTGSAMVYHARVASSNSFRLHRSAFAGKATEVASSGAGLVVDAGDTLALSVSGDASSVTLRGYHNGIEVFSYEDSAPLVAGYPAFGSYLAGDKRVAQFETNLSSITDVALSAPLVTGTAVAFSPRLTLGRVLRLDSVVLENWVGQPSLRRGRVIRAPLTVANNWVGSAGLEVVKAIRVPLLVANNWVAGPSLTLGRKLKTSLVVCEPWVGGIRLRPGKTITAPLAIAGVWAGAIRLRAGRTIKAPLVVCEPWVGGEYVYKSLTYPSGEIVKYPSGNVVRVGEPTLDAEASRLLMLGRKLTMPLVSGTCVAGAIALRQPLTISVGFTPVSCWVGPVNLRPNISLFPDSICWGIASELNNVPGVEYEVDSSGSISGADLHDDYFKAKGVFPGVTLAVRDKLVDYYKNRRGRHVDVDWMGDRDRYGRYRGACTNYRTRKVAAQHYHVELDFLFNSQGI